MQISLTCGATARGTISAARDNNGSILKCGSGCTTGHHVDIKIISGWRTRVVVGSYDL